MAGHTIKVMYGIMRLGLAVVVLIGFIIIYYTEHHLLTLVLQLHMVRARLQPLHLIHLSLQLRLLTRRDQLPLRLIHLGLQLRRLARHEQPIGQLIFMLNLSKPCKPCEEAKKIKEAKKILDSETNRTIAAHLEFKGADIIWSDKHDPLLEVEDYIRQKFKKIDLNLDFDVTASEPLAFNTVNYTTYAGLLIMHPLNYEQSIRQMSDAYADGLKKGHIKFITEREDYSKYTYRFTAEEKPKEALVVLTGGNKLKKHCCVGKLDKILKKHGRDNVIFKKHPVSQDEVYTELSDYLGGINFADYNSNLYALMDNCEYVYSTMKSESALIAYIKGKKVDHFDLSQNRHLGSFTHINNFLYTTPDPLKWADQAFASAKSGVIHPSVDTNWKEKVDEYVEYLLFLQNKYKIGYV